MFCKDFFLSFILEKTSSILNQINLKNFKNCINIIILNILLFFLVEICCKPNNVNNIDIDNFVVLLFACNFFLLLPLVWFVVVPWLRMSFVYHPTSFVPLSFFLFLSITAKKPSGFNVHGTFVSQPWCTLIAPRQQVSVSKGKVSNATTSSFQKKKTKVKRTNNTGGKEPCIRKLAYQVDSLW